MLKYSDITKEYYEPDQCVFYKNMLQSGVYVENGATLLDVILPTKSGERIIFVFSKEDHYRYIGVWDKYKLEHMKEWQEKEANLV